MQMNNTPLYRTKCGMPQANYKAPSKVVSIPVRFVGSESQRTRDRTGSAIKIQKVARGFLVRNSMRRIAAIRLEVEKIESKVYAPETVELIKKEHRERLRVSETIMNLLLKLDSVSVLHYPGVRDYRKSIIKKAIALQEMVDHMVGPTDQDQPQVEDSEGKKIEALGNEEGKSTRLVEEVEENCLVKEEEEGRDVEGKKMEGLRNEEKMKVEEKEEEEDGGGECLGEESVGTRLVKEESGENCLVKEEEGGVGCEEEEEDKEDYKGGRREEGDRNRELLERMMGDNEKMMGMLAQLFQRNEMQTKLLNSLSNRVEQLERAFACEKLRRKKRKNADAKHTEPKPKNGCI
ncbi:uncharacterized protein LOC133316628 [Gastrolobium bilobum]|uniref:uncharacterized protein LOC133316628 n=1 Tax=Gastrolobium bilobum TaxID=150636 RepID=UPI002AB290FB|nr:uncharacterized protein LOC133316628 [Gastrolobium bilobum]